MSALEPAILGIGLVAAGIGCGLLAWFTVRTLRNNRPNSAAPFAPLALPQSPNEEALLLVGPGGQVAYANLTAQEWLGFSAGQRPDLERLARSADPPESFLSLCASEGHARLSLQGLYVEGSSYTLPYNGSGAMVVTLRRSHLATLSGSQRELPQEAIDILSELSQAMSASLDLETTLEAILEGVGRLVHSDFSEIGLWEAGKAALTPYRYHPDANGDRRLLIDRKGYSAGGHLSGRLISTQRPVVVDDALQDLPAPPSTDLARYPIRAYAGVPLMIAGEPIGTLELASLTPSAFRREDLDLLQLLSGQAAVAIQNALTHEQEQQRLAELTGLANLAQATGALSDPQDLYERLMQSISPLLEVEILGLLIYEENRRSLEGKVPFLGLPEQFTAIYRAEIPPGSPAEEILLSQETILTVDAGVDERFDALGLMPWIQAAGVVNTALVPIPAGGRALGYIQAANKLDGTLLTQDELRLMAIIAGQIGPIIENAYLVQEARRRARQAEAMHRISSLAGSGATVDEILKFAVLELARFLGAEVCGVYLLDRERGVLIIHRDSIFGFEAEDSSPISSLRLEDLEFRSTACGSLRPIIAPDLDLETGLPAFYQRILERLPPTRALISVPLEVRGSAVGELILGSAQAGSLGPNEAQVAATAGRQLAAAVERSSLSTLTDEGLRKKLDHLFTLSRVTRSLDEGGDLTQIAETLRSESLSLSKADRGVVRIFDREPASDGQWIVSNQAGSEPASELRPHEEQALESRELAILPERADAARAGLEERVQSAIAIPIQHDGRVVGLISLESFHKDRFDPETISLLSTLASHSAALIDRTTRLEFYQQQNVRLDHQVSILRSLAHTMTPGGSAERLRSELNAIAGEISEAADFAAVSIFTLGDLPDPLELAAGAGVAEGSAAGFFSTPRPWSEFEEAMEPGLALGPAYRIPADWQGWPGGPGPAPGEAVDWSPGDLLFIPLYDESGQPAGIIGLEAPRSLWPDQATARSLEPLAEEAARLVTRYRRMTALEEELMVLGVGLSPGSEGRGGSTSFDTGELEGAAQPDAIRALNQRVRRMRSTLDIAEAVNQQPDRPSVLWAFGQEVLKKMEADLALIADLSQSGPRLLHTIGAIPASANPQALFGQRNPLRDCLDDGGMLLVNDLAESPEWQETPFLLSLNAKAFVAIPIRVNGTIEAALLAIHQTPQPPFREDDRQIYHMLAVQVGIAMQNLDLLTETRRRLREVDLLLDFSRQLGSLDPAEILTTLVTSTLQVVGSAHAGMVALWDEQEGLLLPKASAGYTDNEQIKQISYRAGEALPGRVFARGEPLLVEELNFAEKYKLSPENLLRYREATGGRLPVSSMVIPLQATGSPLGVIVLDNFNTTSAFTVEDQALIMSLAQQTAFSLDNARLFQAAEERAAQLRSLTEISATITSSLQTDELISTLLDQFSALLKFDTGTLWLRHGSQLTIRAARGFDESEGRIGLTANVEDSQLLHEMVTAGQPISVENTHADARFPALVEHPYLSWLGIPLISKGEVAGVIALEKAEPGFYRDEHIQIARTFAAQATVALENARLFEESLRRAGELDERSRRLDRLNLTSTELSKSLDPDYILVFTISELQQALRADGVAVALVNPHGRPVLQVETPSRGEKLPIELPELQLFDRLRETQGVFSTANIARESDLAPLHEFFEQRQAASLACLPMATASDLHGLVMVYSAKEERFPAGEIELATTITNQAAIAYQNARQYEETRQFSHELERRVAERTRELENEHRRTKILLNIITELSASLDLDIIINRTLVLINEITDAEQSTVLLAQPEEANFIFRASRGFTTPPSGGGESTWLKVDEGLAGWVITNQQGVLIPDLLEDPRWVHRPDQETEHRSAIAVPLVAGAESLGTLMIFHREPGRFSSDMLDLVQAIAQQIAVAINNAQLYLLIRDQAERLGGMLRSQQIETTRSRAILESVAEGVLVTDATGVITLFNYAGEEILGLDQDLMMEKALDEFTGLFGKATHSWMETIRFWSSGPGNARANEIYEEEIELEDGKVVSVSLSPVILRDEFLGTVSIFHDITHQVEVDRLKSEFVATVSHELRTPMTSIKGYVDVLLMGAAGELTEQQQRFLEIVKSNTERLNILVDDLLDISRIEAGKVNLSIQPLDLREIAERVILTAERRAKSDAKPIAIDFHPQSNLPRILGDPGRVSQILSNLVDNAYNYTPTGGQITVTLLEFEKEVRVIVADNGIGIGEEEQERVFERFYRGEDPLVLATAGTGLGLSIVRQLVEMHGGQLWLESSGKPGEGSTFSFSIPVYTSGGEVTTEEEYLPEVSA